MDKKPLAALVIAKMRKKPSSSEEKYSEEEPEDDMEEGLQAAAEDVLSALEGGDATALKEALKSFIEQC